MSQNRSASRDVFIYNAEGRDTQLGGLILNKGITNSNFYSMINILCILKSSPVLRDEHDIVVEQNNDQLKPGNYYLADKLINFHFKQSLTLKRILVNE